MRIRNALVAAAASAVLPLAMFAAGGSASAATPSCTPNFYNNSNGILDCLTPFNQEFGLNYFWDVFHAQAKVGTPVILFQNSTHDGAQDFSYYDNGLVSDFAAASLVSAAVNLHYGGDEAFEAEYTPYGVPTNLCVGVAATAGWKTPVSLQPCGATSKTLWILDGQDSNCPPFSHGHRSITPPLVKPNGGGGGGGGGQGGGGGGHKPPHHSLLPAGYVPLINGSDTNFSHPFVLTYPSNGAAPWDKPRPQLITANLSIFSNGTVFDNQMWGLTYSGPQQSFPPKCSHFFGHLGDHDHGPRPRLPRQTRNKNDGDHDSDDA